MTELVLIERSNNIATVTLNRADKKNALTSDMYAVIADLLEAAEKEMQARNRANQASRRLEQFQEDAEGQQPGQESRTPDLDDKNLEEYGRRDMHRGNERLSAAEEAEDDTDEDDDVDDDVAEYDERRAARAEAKGARLY